MGLSQHDRSSLLYHHQTARTIHMYITHAPVCDATVHLLDDAPRGLMSKLA